METNLRRTLLPRRLTAGFVVLLLVLHSLPPAGVCMVGDAPWCGKICRQACIGALDICDDGQGFAGFLAAHPWITGPHGTPLFIGSETEFFDGDEGGCREGFPPPLFRPPEG